MAYDDSPFFEGVRMAEKESLVIASKVKNYIKETSELKCSAAVIDVLSEKVRVLCDEAMKNAKADGRKTVQEKDFR
jgi:histone H3/H4